MNTPATTMGDDDIRAFSRPEPLPPPARRRRWPWVLLALALLGLVLTLSLGSMLWHGIDGPHGLAGAGDWHVDIDGHDWHAGHGELGFGGVVAAIVAVALALCVVAVVVPLVLLGVGLAVGLSLTLAALAVVTVLGLLLGSAALVLLLLSSPLWLLGLLLWWALKPAKPVAPAVASAPSA